MYDICAKLLCFEGKVVEGLKEIDVVIMVLG